MFAQRGFRPFSKAVSFRKLHFTSPVARVLVGPPDRVSHIRPVQYDDGIRPTASGDAPTTSAKTHPYSLEEFSGDIVEYRWRLERQQLDEFNHHFWADNNTRYAEAKESIMSGLPDATSPEDRDAILSTFYRAWLLQEELRQREYTEEWRRRNLLLIGLSARVSIHRLKTRFLNMFPGRKS